MNCHCNHSGLGALARVYGLGEIVTGPPMNPGDPFEFAYNVGYFGGPFQVANVAIALEDAGVSYDTRSYKLTGTLNPFIVVEGKSNAYVNSAGELKSAIYNTIKGAGFPIEAGTLKFDYRSSAQQTGPEPAAGTINDPGYTTGGGSNNTNTGGTFWDSIADSLDLPKTEAKVLAIGGAVVLAILFTRR